MATEELQNYINQSRASGQSDEQIRQSLLSQGWNQQDIDLVLGNSSNSAPSQPKSKSKLGLILLLLFALALLGVGAYAYFMKDNFFPKSIYSDEAQDLIDEANRYSNSPTPTPSPAPSSSNTGKVCGNFPDEDGGGATFMQFSAKLDDSTSFHEMPLFPGHTKLAMTGTLPSSILACAKATNLATVVGFYQGVANAQFFDMPAGGSYDVFGFPALKVIEMKNPSRASLNVADAGGGNLLLLYHLK